MVTVTLTRTDEHIQKDALAEMEWDARVQPNEIGVVVKDGVVTLTGWWTHTPSAGPPRRPPGLQGPSHAQGRGGVAVTCHIICSAGDPPMCAGPRMRVALEA
jgi:hypothetical protein